MERRYYLAANAGLIMEIIGLKMEVMLREGFFVSIRHVQQKLKIDKNAFVEEQSLRMEEHIPETNYLHIVVTVTRTK